jgi:hypothetical protein
VSGGVAKACPAATVLEFRVLGFSRAPFTPSCAALLHASCSATRQRDALKRGPAHAAAASPREHRDEAQYKHHAGHERGAHDAQRRAGAEQASPPGARVEVPCVCVGGDGANGCCVAPPRLCFPAALSPCTPQPWNKPEFADLALKRGVLAVARRAPLREALAVHVLGAAAAAARRDEGVGWVGVAGARLGLCAGGGPGGGGWVWWGSGGGSRQEGVGGCGARRGRGGGEAAQAPRRPPKQIRHVRGSPASPPSPLSAAADGAARGGRSGAACGRGASDAPAGATSSTVSPQLPAAAGPSSGRRSTPAGSSSLSARFMAVPRAAGRGARRRAGAARPLAGVRGAGVMRAPLRRGRPRRRRGGPRVAAMLSESSTHARAAVRGAGRPGRSARSAVGRMGAARRRGGMREDP